MHTISPDNRQRIIMYVRDGGDCWDRFAMPQGIITPSVSVTPVPDYSGFVLTHSCSCSYTCTYIRTGIPGSIYQVCLVLSANPPVMTGLTLGMWLSRRNQNTNSIYIYISTFANKCSRTLYLLLKKTLKALLLLYPYCRKHIKGAGILCGGITC